MADYRKMWLVNASGNRYDFTDINRKVFLNTPMGFGFTRSYTTKREGSAEKVTSLFFSLMDITGELLFYDALPGQMYRSYQEFIQFCKYRPLEFHYQTPNQIGDESWYSDVLFVSAEKNEADKDRGLLPVMVTFHRLSQWQPTTPNVIEMTGVLVGTDGKQYNALGDSPYNLKRPYNYIGTDLTGKKIINTGTEDVGFIIEIGPYDDPDFSVTNPMFSISQNGELYAACALDGTFGYVYINSTDGHESMVLRNTSGIVLSNPESYQDFTVVNGLSYVTWCKLIPGESVFSYQDESSTFTGKITIQYRDSYPTI